MKKYILFLFAIFTMVSIISCSNSGYEYVEGKLNVVATTTMIGDLANEVGGENVSVTTLMNTGVDPHLYQPKASDTNALLKADLVIMNGLHLEGQMGEVLEQLEASKLLIIGDYLPEENIVKDDQNIVDPHIWFNVENWILATDIVSDKMIALDSERSEAYNELRVSYKLELDVLQTYVLSRVAELDEDKRVLVTAHDAFNYFGQAYGFDVYAIQGISTESEASVDDIQQLARLVRDLDVKAIFVESSIPVSTINSVVESAGSLGHELAIGGELFSDSLGDESTDAETYIKTVMSNVDTIVDSLK